MAEQKVTISGLDELLLFMGTIEKKEASWEDVDLETLSVVIPVRVEGEGWDGQFDFRGGRLVADAQMTVAAVYKDFSGEAFPRNALLKAKSTEKCNLLNIDVSAPLRTMVENMPPEYTLAAVLAALATWGGVNVYRHYVDRCKNRDQTELIQTALQSMENVATTAIKEGRDLTIPMRRYIRSLSPEDTIAIADGADMNKREARAMIPAPVKEEDDEYFTHCDGVFALHGVDIKQDHPVLKISQNGVEVQAYFFARVPPAAKTAILSAVDARLEGQPPKSMSLQVECYFTDKVIRHCVIRDAGDPRENMRHYALTEIPGSVAGKDKLLTGLN